MLPVRALQMRSPSVGGASWVDVRDGILNADSVGWANYTVRQRIDAAGLLDVSGTQIRFTFEAAASAPLTITKAYFGLEGGTDYDFAGTPTAITFAGGSASAVIAQAGSVVSDAITFTYSGTADLVVTIYTGSAQAAYRTTGTPANGDLKYKSGDDAATVTASGYVTDTPTRDVIKKIEIA